MGMVLVACENFEAYNNVQRARDYYGREHPSLRDAFATVRRFVREGLVTPQSLRRPPGQRPRRRA